MGKTWHDSPSKKRDIAIKKSERGTHRKMDPYKRSNVRNWEYSQS